jgi:hypothetical protein
VGTKIVLLLPYLMKMNLRKPWNSLSSHSYFLLGLFDMWHLALKEITLHIVAIMESFMSGASLQGLCNF